MKEVLKLKHFFLLMVTALSCFIMTSCGDDKEDEPPSSDPSEMIIGKWICYNDAYGAPWEEPLVYQFDSDGSGYGWFQDEPFSNRWEFTYIVTPSKIRFSEYDKYDDSWYRYNLRYELSTNGKSLVLYGYDDNDMEELHFVKQ